MKKEFIDYLYELRALVQLDIDRLVESRKQPTAKCCDNMSGQNENEAELRTRRSQIQSINKTIEKYFEIHSKPV